MNHRALVFLLASIAAPPSAVTASDAPTSVPSSQPSTQPSTQPSSIPSQQPSSIPSTQPSRQPSSIPSQQPSSIPSTQPSRQPSSSPSEQPSSIPSVQPTGQPSSIPSSQPSCTPSSSPSDYATAHLFYPDWSSGGSGCKNDSKEPSYMAANPSYYMSTTLLKCCTTYFGWNYDVCMGNERGVCKRALWYPDWEGKNAGCINDGNEPKYMTDNAVNMLFVHPKDCCDKHYPWDVAACTGVVSSLNSGFYYPDFGGSKNICVTGGGQPDYMNNAPSVWMHATLKECCSTNYQYNYNACVGSDPSAAAATGTTTPGLYYPDWLGDNKTCKNDNEEPPYMTLNPTQWMLATLKACCEKNYSWAKEGCEGASASAGAVGDNLWYKRSADWVCVQDCTLTGVVCGGVRSSWETSTYATRAKCCASIPYDKDCNTRTISVLT